MSELLGALAEILERGRLDGTRPLVLQEPQRSAFERLTMSCPSEMVALRLGPDDYLRILAETRLVRRLPDYVIFAAPPPSRGAGKKKGRSELVMQVLVCELKSGAKGAEEARHQLRRGRLLGEYLLGLAALHQEASAPAAHQVEYCGLVCVPRALYRKGGTKPEAAVNANREWDALGQMWVHRVTDGGEVQTEQFLVRD